MSAKKNAATKTNKATQAKATKKKSKAAAAPVEVATAPASECPRGGEHDWAEEDGTRQCAKCHEPEAAPAKKKRGKAKATEATTTDAPATEKKAKGRKAKAKPATESGDQKLSAIDAAAKVLTESTEPLNAKQMIEAMAAKGYWTSPGGKTPHATLYSAILREITAKGNEARFKKTERGHFAITREQGVAIRG